MEAANSPRLSVAILARNCAPQLLATIESVRALAAEIVVLDTGSTDDTIIAALKAGASVHRRSWDDDFAAARNACLGHATGDWILWLDAGETIGPDQAQKLRDFLANSADPNRAYSLAISLPAGEGQLSGEQMTSIRLHPRPEGLRFAGRVRERMDDSLARLGVQVEPLAVAIERSVRDHEPAVKAGKAQRNIRLADLQLAEQGPSADLHNCLGEAFQALGDSTRAAQHYRRALDLVAGGSREQLEAYYGLLTCLDGAGADRSAQLALCMQGLERFPLDAQLLVALGGYLQALGQVELAIRAYDVAFRHGQIEPQIWHLPEIREIGAVCAASALLTLSKDDEARSLLEAATRVCPQSVRIARQLVELHVKHGRRDEALAAVASLPDDMNRQAWLAGVRGACLVRTGNFAAAQTHLQVALESGCRERFCYRSLVAAWLGLGQPAEARSVLRVWQSLDGGNSELAAFAATIEEQLAADPSSHESLSVSAGSLRLDSAESPDPHVSPSKAGIGAATSPLSAR